MLSQLSNQAAMAEIGRLIRELRLQQLLSQDELATRAGIGIATLNRLENGMGNPTLAVLVPVLRVLGRLDAVGATLAPTAISPIALADAQRKAPGSAPAARRQRAPRSDRRAEQVGAPKSLPWKLP